MLTEHRCPVSLSLVSFDLPIWSVVETAATLYQKDADRFHLLLTEPPVIDRSPVMDWSEVSGELGHDRTACSIQLTPRLLWLELSPYRVIMTMQGNGPYSYRHFWEQGVYGLSRYWLQNSLLTPSCQLRLRNFTRHLVLRRQGWPTQLRVDYELWSNQLQIGHYVMNLELHH